MARFKRTSRLSSGYGHRQKRKRTYRSEDDSSGTDESSQPKKKRRRTQHKPPKMIIPIFYSKDNLIHKFQVSNITKVSSLLEKFCEKVGKSVDEVQFMFTHRSGRVELLSVRSNRLCVDKFDGDDDDITAKCVRKKVKVVKAIRKRGTHKKKYINSINRIEM